MPNETGLQTFLRMANLFGPQQNDDAYGSMPTNLPTGGGLVNRISSGQHEPQPLNANDDNYWMNRQPDEELFAQSERPTSALEAFRQSAMNPPQREHMTYPKSTLNGLTEALKIAAEPSPLAKNRVWVNGVAHQKMNVRTDPVTGEKQYVTNVHEPAFMDQVMRAMPAAVSAGVDIANQPYQDAVSDWELKNKGLSQAVGAESQMALANQRNATAGYTGQKADIERDKLAITRMTAEERVRASQLNTLTDEEKLQQLQEGKIELADLNNAAAMKRVEAAQAGATQRTGMQQTGATTRTGMEQTGATTRTGMQQTGATLRTGMEQTGATQRNNATNAAKGAGGGAVSETQRKVASQRRAAEIINQNPEYREFISTDLQGYPTISPDTPDEVYGILYEALNRQDQKDINLPAQAPAAPIQQAPMAPVAPQAPAPIAPNTGSPIAPVTNAAPIAPRQAPVAGYGDPRAATTQAPPAPAPTQGKIRVIAPNGKTGTWDLSAGPLPRGFKKVQ